MTQPAKDPRCTCGDPIYSRPEHHAALCPVRPPDVLPGGRNPRNEWPHVATPRRPVGLTVPPALDEPLLGPGSETLLDRAMRDA